MMVGARDGLTRHEAVRWFRHLAIELADPVPQLFADLVAEPELLSALTPELPLVGYSPFAEIPSYDFNAQAGSAQSTGGNLSSEPADLAPRWSPEANDSRGPVSSRLAEPSGGLRMAEPGYQGGASAQPRSPWSSRPPRLLEDSGIPAQAPPQGQPLSGTDVQQAIGRPGVRDMEDRAFRARRWSPPGEVDTLQTPGGPEVHPGTGLDEATGLNRPPSDELVSPAGLLDRLANEVLEEKSLEPRDETPARPHQRGGTRSTWTTKRDGRPGSVPLPPRGDVLPSGYTARRSTRPRAGGGSAIGVAFQLIEWLTEGLYSSRRYHAPVSPMSQSGLDRLERTTTAKGGADTGALTEPQASGLFAPGDGSIGRGISLIYSLTDYLLSPRRHSTLVSPRSETEAGSAAMTAAQRPASARSNLAPQQTPGPARPTVMFDEVPQQGSLPPSTANELFPDGLGTGDPASGAQLDADALTSLINDVLVEQARRHGVDLA